MESPGNQSDVVFRMTGVTKRFRGVVALHDISLEIRRGERVGLVGPSGAGKTTLLKLMAGMYQPSEGGILVEGHLAGKLSRTELRVLRRRTGFIHQSFDLVPELRVVSNVIAGGLGSRSLLGALRDLLWPRRADLLRVHDALQRVDLVDKMYARTATLSGGQVQRVAVARVLFQNPETILADEPVSSVDPARARDLLEMLRRINEATAKPVVLSLHAIDLARDFCTRLIGLREGRVLFDLPAADIEDGALSRLYDLGGRGNGAS